MRHPDPSSGNFMCAHCQTIVSAAHLLSGVNNRNHCPFCLWSRHLDLYAAGLSSEQILAEMPDLEMEDLKAALRYAALRLDHPVLAT